MTRFRNVRFSPELRRNLRGLGTVGRNEVSKKVGLAMGLALMSKAVPEAPVVSGSLRRSGTTEETDDGARSGFGIEYARRIHEGFDGQDTLGRTYNQPGNPYMVRGARAARRDMVEDAKVVLRKEVKKHTV